MSSRTPVPRDRGAARPDPVLRSAKHPAVARLRALSSDAAARRTEAAFVLEGPVALAQALEAGVVLEAVYVAGGPGDTAAVAADRSDGPGGPSAAGAGAMGGRRAQLGRVLAALPRGVAVHHVAEDLLRRATAAVTPQGVAAVARRPRHHLADVPTGEALLVLVGLADPGNVGTLVRSAEAAGIGAVLCTAGAVDPWSPKAVRASAGSVLRVPVISGREASVVLDEVRATGRSCIGTRAADAPAFDEADLPRDVAIVLGNEAHGLPADLDGRLDGWVRIPMAGRVESLNVAMAGTLLCFEVARRRRAA